jgi:hypothetical protein
VPLRSGRTAPLAACALALAAVAALAPPAHARKHLWATINVCDSEHHPDDIGIRARMPGDGSALEMYMRFLVQYRKEGRWEYVPSGGRSPWVRAGSARFRYQERGYTFSFDPPAAGTRFVMRGLVKFEWRRRGRVVERTHRATSSGHPSAGADPPRYSAARCVMEGPPPPEQPPYQDPVG